MRHLSQTNINNELLRNVCSPGGGSLSKIKQIEVFNCKFGVLCHIEQTLSITKDVFFIFFQFFLHYRC